MSEFRRRLLTKSIPEDRGNGFFIYYAPYEGYEIKIVSTAIYVTHITLEDGTPIEVPSFSYDPIYYTSPKEGEIKIKIRIRRNLTYWNDYSPFQNCTDLIRVESDLFYQNINFKNPIKIFKGCSNLVSVPDDFFRKMKNINYITEAFSGCFSLINTPKDEDGGELWERVGKQGYNMQSDGGTQCFYNCTSLSNYNEIPSEWK